MERSHQSPGAPRRLGQHLLSLRTWHLHAICGWSYPSSGWGQEWAVDTGSKNSPAGGVLAFPSCWTKSGRHRFSSTVIQHMHDSSEQELGHLQAACPSPQGAVSPADLLLTTLPGLSIAVSPEEMEQGGQELRLPSSTAKTLSPLPSLSPPHTCKPPETHTCTHMSPFSLLPTSPHKPWLSLFSTWLPGLEGARKIIGSSLPTQNCGLDIFCNIPNKASPSSS